MELIVKKIYLFNFLTIKKRLDTLSYKNTNLLDIHETPTSPITE